MIDNLYLQKLFEIWQYPDELSLTIIVYPNLFLSKVKHLGLQRNAGYVATLDYRTHVEMSEPNI